MLGGVPVDRQFVVSLTDGRMIIDWGDGVCQEVRTGAFFKSGALQISYPATDSDLDWLVKTGVVSGYDQHRVYFNALPDRPLRFIE